MSGRTENKCIRLRLIRAAERSRVVGGELGKRL